MLGKGSLKCLHKVTLAWNQTTCGQGQGCCCNTTSTIAIVASGPSGPEGHLICFPTGVLVGSCGSVYIEVLPLHEYHISINATGCKRRGPNFLTPLIHFFSLPDLPTLIILLSECRKGIPLSRLPDLDNEVCGGTRTKDPS